MTASPPRVLVLGAGIVGTTAAYYLARRGCRVTVVERREGAGLETSFANGGLVTPSMADPWAAPGIPLKLLKWLGREDSPFLLRPRALPGLLSWGVRFLRNCTEATWRRNTGTIFRLAGYSQDCLERLTAETGIAYDQGRLGTLRLFRDRLSMENARRSAEAVGAYGVEYRAVDAAECAAIEPALQPELRQISGGIHFPGDTSADAHLLTRAVERLCREMGVEFRYGETVERIEAANGAVSGIATDAGRHGADHTLVALGNGAADLLRPLGLRLPIYPVKGYSVTLSAEGWNGAPKVPLVDDGRKMGINRLGDRLRLAGTAEFTGTDTALNPRRGANLVESFRELFPGFANAESARHWAGLRPMTPDGIPILGATPYRNLTLNAGHGHLGLTLACGSGQAVADLITGARPALDLGGMALDRF